MTKNIGINFESGKIIDHILKFKNCVAYANIQIAMDAPYDGRVADESLRSKGRSEQQFNPEYGYDERKLQHTLYHIFEHIKFEYPDTRIVIQIARGRASETTFEEVLKPVIKRLDLIDKLTEFKNKEGIIKKYKGGYRTDDYYTPDKKDSKFVFVNYGMFAVLTNFKKITVGMICNVVKTAYLDMKDDKISIIKVSKQNNKKNILYKLGDFPKLYLMGIADNMPFVTPDKYSREEIDKIIKDFIK